MGITYSEAIIELPKDSLHVYEWIGRQSKPLVLFVPIHGLMMNGKAFDAMAKQLADRGANVVAPDIRGFGKWYFDEEKETTGVDYKRSLEDISGLIYFLKSKYPKTPIVCLGESLGAHFARSVVALKPDLIDALILSSPCVRPRMVSPSLIPHAVNEILEITKNPNREVNLEPFARKFLQSEPDNLSSYLNDPLARKSLELKEILNSVRIVRSLRLKAVSPEIPILVFRGDKDCVCKLKSMEKFINSLKSSNISYHKLKECGHLIMQSQNISEEIVEVIMNWCKLEVV